MKTTEILSITGGTLLTVIESIITKDAIITTIVLGSLGAVVSFVVTQFMKWVFKKVFKK